MSGGQLASLESQPRGSGLMSCKLMARLGWLGGCRQHYTLPSPQIT
jgi:hypothetical protein